MFAHSARVSLAASILTGALIISTALRAQETPPQQPAPAAALTQQQTPSERSGQSAEPPKGVEVLTRGPVHEAFATPTADPQPTRPVSKKPPKPLDEMPPAEKPEGEVTWIGGYWAWDDDRKDFIWVSGVWRVPPPGKRWVSGYWKEEGEQSRWVPGFWAHEEKQEESRQDVTYLPEPPKPPEVAAPAKPAAEDTFYVPGEWMWHDAGYAALNGTQVWREAGYSWRAGYWARVQPGYVWVAAHYVWTPSGYVYQPGYWDYALPKRGILYAPVYVDAAYVGPTFVYTPAYAVSDTVLIDAMWVRPCYCHYYFGDYYGVTYTSLGFESCVVYSRRCYDPIFVYATWEHRYEPSWVSLQINLYDARCRGLAPCPPRTFVQQNTIIQQNITNVTNVNNTTIVNNNVNRTSAAPVVAPTAQIAAARGSRMVPVDSASRAQARQQAQAVQQVAMQRSQVERPASGAALTQPRSTSLRVPSSQPVGSPGPAARGAGSPGSSGAASSARTAAASAGAYRPGTAANPAYPGSSNQAYRPGQVPSQRGPLQPTRPGMPQQRPAPRPQPRPAHSGNSNQSRER